MAKFGALGFLGDDLQNGQRLITLGGGFTHDISTLSDQNILSGLFGYDRTDANAISENFKEYFNSNGWNIQSFDVSAGNTNQYGFTASLYLYNNYTAENARQSMLSMFQAYTTQGFSNFFVQIISDTNLNNGQTISDINTKQIASAPQSNGAIITTGVTNTVNEISSKGLLPIAGQGLSTILFGAGNENFNLLGFKVDKVLAIGGGVLGLLVFTKLSGNSRSRYF